ncbi:MAG: hypothetical protein KGI68_15010 [Alphaproteobacteria bacterium]|nr:hypothetical protein [Alphaproteobacteria bacterium]MDE1987430.1 hypothetical protein [Alphaproteobacteria bacterium]MDE2164246.1 hypothetical protein [Alphaproteobacteria bacterium]
MREGLYKVQFQTQIGEGAGVFVLHQGRIVGGDSIMYFTGTYSDKDGAFSADVHGIRHTASPNNFSVFGADDIHVHLTGTTVGDRGQVIGKADEAPKVIFQAIFSRVADL